MSSAKRRFQLFISGRSPNSRSATANVTRALSRPEFAQIEIEIIDILDRPDRAEELGVTRTPTIVALDDTRRRIAGDLSALAEILAFLRGM